MKEGYRPGQVIMSDAMLDALERGELHPSVSRFDQTTGATEYPKVTKKDDGKIIRYTIGGTEGEQIPQEKARDIVDRFQSEQVLFTGHTKDKPAKGTKVTRKGV